MNRSTKQRWATGALALAAVAAVVTAQDVGSRRGGANPPGPSRPERAGIADYIEVEGSAELRIAPSEARIVVGFVVQSPDVAGGRAALDAQLVAVTAALEAAGVARADVRRDFIAVTPVYTWGEGELSGARAFLEQRTGFQLAENLHVHVRSLANLPAVRAAALGGGASDLIAFEYGAEDLDGAREVALERAIGAAQRKAGVLLDATFGASRPAPLNVRERVTVHAPADLYETYTATSSSGGGYVGGGNLPRVPAARPLTTYYRGFDQDVDVRGGGLALDPEFSVVARVWLYFGAPGREQMVPGSGR